MKERQSSIFTQLSLLNYLIVIRRMEILVKQLLYFMFRI